MSDIKQSNGTIVIAFLGALVPDTLEYQNLALRRSGNLVQDGVAIGLKRAGAEVEIFSAQPRASFPKNKKLFYRGKTILYKSLKLHLVSFVNLIVIKTIWITIVEMFLLLRWALQNRKKNRAIVVYNTYTPPLPIVWLIGKLTRSKTFAILYDLGMPPKELNLGLLRMTIYKFVEFFSKTFIPKLDGRITINDAIGQDYAGGKDYIVIDGGLSEDILSLIRGMGNKTHDNDAPLTLFLGGSLSPINGSRLIGELLNNSNLDLKLVIAGAGHDKEYIEGLAKTYPNKVEYLGLLTLEELFKIYSRCDILMNLRILSPKDRYLFPSKVIEYMSTGIPVITTNASHIGARYGNYCFVLKDATSQALEEVIKKIMTMPVEELMSKSNSAQKYMLETHTWDAMSEQIYKYIVSKVC